MGLDYRNPHIDSIKKKLARQYDKNRFIKFGEAYSRIERYLKKSDEAVLKAISLLKIKENSNERVRKYLPDRYFKKYTKY